ncbi:hypothetical protein JCM15765_04430 [Paradesulfitobacterium aromaticivorans]
MSESIEKNLDSATITPTGVGSDAWELIKYHAQIRSELPKLLAQLVQKGKQEDALRLLTGWGTREIKNSQIWKEAKSLLETA